MGRKFGGGAVPFFEGMRGAGSPSNTMRPGLRPSSVQPYGHNTWAKKWGAVVPPFWGDGFPSNTISPGPRPTSVSSGILIQPAVWPQQTWAKNGGYAPLEGELGPHLTQCGRG